MPVCYHFLRGLCSKDPCMYRHVKVDDDAIVCEAFLTGYCAAGDSCKYKHTARPKKAKASSSTTSKPTSTLKDDSRNTNSKSNFNISVVTPHSTNPNYHQTQNQTQNQNQKSSMNSTETLTGNNTHHKDNRVVNRRTSTALNTSLNQSTNQQINEPIHQPNPHINQPRHTNQLIAQAINHPPQPTHQPTTNQQINQPNQWLKLTKVESIIQPTRHLPINPSANPPIKHKRTGLNFDTTVNAFGFHSQVGAVTMQDY